MDIQRILTLVNRCSYWLNRQLSSKALSRCTKLTLYKTLSIAILIYGGESGSKSAADEKSLGTSRGQLILRKTFSPNCVNAEYRRRINQELYKFYNDVELPRHVKILWLRWLGHLVRMDEQAPTRRVFETDTSAKSPQDF